MKPIFGDNIVVVSSNADYDAFGYNRIEDLISDKGPVGGLYTALKQSKTKFNLVLSVDVPLITTELVQWLVDNHDDGYLVTQVQVGEKGVWWRFTTVLCEHYWANIWLETN